MMRSALSLLLLGLASCGGETETKSSGAWTIESEVEARVGRTEMLLTITHEGLPIEAAQVTVDPQMPSHGHGSTEVPAVEALGEGRYRAFPVTFTMPGLWEVTVHATGERAEDEGLRVFDVSVR